MSCLEILVAITLHLGLEGDYNNIHPLVMNLSWEEINES